MCRYVCACVYAFVNILKNLKTLKKFKNKNIKKAKKKFIKNKNSFFDPQHVLDGIF
jgi:hypothetical protein